MGRLSVTIKLVGETEPVLVSDVTDVRFTGEYLEVDYHVPDGLRARLTLTLSHVQHVTEQWDDTLEWHKP